jgi:3-hydroxyacyl-CoA dehydrogenase/3a,7a,12a-trihydroxy-5b-cholest-24-enoyl-CoA hydratase
MLRFDNKVVVITGAGRGIGLEYAKFFASRGAKLVLNDLGQENGKFIVDIEAQKLRDQYKIEVATNTDSVEFGEKIIGTAVKAFGKFDILINNAGILKDKSMSKMTPEDWDIVIKVHLTGTFRCTLAAWPIFRKQKFGRIINTGSSTGLFGNFGQSNYGAAKAGIHGFTLTTAKEGEPYNIKCNTIAPVAATRMTQGLMPEEILAAVDPKYVVSCVGLLAHDECPDNGGMFEVGGGWITKLRLQRAEGATLPVDYTPELLKENWKNVVDFERQNDYPTSGSDSISKMFANYEKGKNSKPVSKVETHKKSEYKSDEIYLLMKAYVEAGLAKNAVKKCNASYQFNILDKKDGQIVVPFWVDIREGKEKAGSGNFENPDATFVMTDEDFNNLCLGKLNPQMAFVKRQMKIVGNFKKASAFTPDLFPKPTPENIQKYRTQTPKL